MDINLGYMDGNRYRLHDGSLSKLKKLNSALDSDTDLTLRSRILREKVLDNQIIQALVHLRPEIDLDIIEEIIQILCKLTAQIDCMGEMLKPVTGQLYSEHTLYLSKVKDVFNEPKFTWPILKLLKLYISELDKNEKKIEDCLVLVQNLLSISEHYAGTMAAAVIANLQRPSRQYGFIWYILYQNFDSLLLTLIRAHRFPGHVVRIVLLLYQGIKPNKLQRLVQEWVSTSSITSSDITYPESTTSSPTSRKPRSSDPDSPSLSPQSCVLVNASELSDKEEKDPLRPTSSLAGEYSNSVSNEPNSTPLRRTPNKKSKESEYSSGEVESSISAPLKEGNGDDGEENNEPPSKRLKLWKLNSKPRRLRTKKERDLKYKDLGISSGPGDGNSSEDEETDTWLVKNLELSDLGYVSYMTENEKKKRRNASNFDSLTEDEKRARWKKLSEARLKGTHRKSRTLFYNLATEADVLDILTDFAITFLLQGYLVLHEDIFKIIRTSTSQDKEVFMYKEFFSWLIYYFLPLASIMSMPLNQVPLNYDIFHYLISECSAVAIQVFLSRSPSVEDLKIISGYVRAQRCFVEILSKYEDNFQLDQIEKYNLKLTSLQIVKTKNVRQLYVFLTWLASKKNLNSTQFLSDLVVANHIHLAKIQSLNVFKADFNMTDHILQFAAPSMMTPYGFLLEKYRENTNTVNDCIFTMMHHVAGDLSCPQALNIEPMKKTIRQITQQGVVLCDDWQDLIEYLANFYSKTNATRDPAVRSVYSDPGWQVRETADIKPSAVETMVVKPTANEIAAVEPAAVEPEAIEPAVVKPITTEPTAAKGVSVKPTAVERTAHDYEPKVEESSVVKRSACECAAFESAARKRLAVESAALKRPAVESAAVESSAVDTTAGEPKIEYEPEKENQVDEVRFLDKKKMRRMSDCTGGGRFKLNLQGPENSIQDISISQDILRTESLGTSLSWLQSSLLDAWRVKIALAANSNSLIQNLVPLEPLPHFHMARGLPVPLFVYNAKLQDGLVNLTFRKLIRNIGLKFQGEIVVIPSYVTQSDLLKAALELGPVQDESLYPELFMV